MFNFFFSQHLSARYCIDIWGRNSLLSLTGVQGLTLQFLVLNTIICLFGSLSIKLCHIVWTSKNDSSKLFFFKKINLIIFVTSLWFQVTKWHFWEKDVLGAQISCLTFPFDPYLAEWSEEQDDRKLEWKHHSHHN